MTEDYTTGRGEPWEHDPGPAKNRKWARLFSQTPNFRALGVAVTGREKFRWHFGPMYYRGRLGDRQVKVLVVGQEGAQDESLSHRSFTGSTGGRMQHVLNHLGITRSYLFLNTFVYPIYGQYSGKKIAWLAQDAASPILQQRHAIFDYVLERNDVHLVIAVGQAAKESVKTWVESHGGNCPDGSEDLSTCDGQVLGPRTKVIGVLHPGGASSGEVEPIKADFQRAFQQVADWAAADPDWLPVDPGATRGAAADYEYGRAPIPFRDFPYGTPWQLGRDSTSSNRQDDQRSIQIFSADGNYNGQGHNLTYPDAAEGDPEGYADDPGDQPYEPPAKRYRDYDGGPSRRFARLMAGGARGYEWPDFTALGADAHPSFGRGAIYRGRPGSARVIVLADQQSHDDLFMARALTGEAGQRFQGFLTAMGLTHSYLILRVLPIDTLDLAAATREALVDDPQVRKVYAKIVATAAAANQRRKVLLAMGPYARRLAPHVNPGLPLVELSAWSEDGAAANWQAALDQLAQIDYAKDQHQPSFVFAGARGQIPRHDLPFGVLRWQGTSGDRARKALRDGNPSPDYFKLYMPQWAYDLAPTPLSTAEEKAIENAPS